MTISKFTAALNRFRWWQKASLFKTSTSQHSLFCEVFTGAEQNMSCTDDKFIKALLDIKQIAAGQ